LLSLGPDDHDKYEAEERRENERTVSFQENNVKNKLKEPMIPPYPQHYHD